jgi:hypothetical protein
MTDKNIITINGHSYDAVTGKPLVPLPASPDQHKVPSGSAAALQQNVPQASRGRSHGECGTDLLEGRCAAEGSLGGQGRWGEVLAFTHPHRPTAPTEQAKKPKAHRAFSDIGPAHSLHQQPQRSQTLYRRALKKPTPQQSTLQPVDTSPTVTVHHRSPAISKFAPSTVQVQPATPFMPPEPPISNQPPRTHPIVAKVVANSPAIEPLSPQSSRELKEALIRERLAGTTPNAQPAKRRKQRLSRSRLSAIVTSSLALLLLGGYLTYINLPNISMRVAAVRSGVSAKYPSYNPDGYHFAGPITYQPGEVNISFKSDTDSKSFVIKQKPSSWDSQAVLSNYVTKQTGTYLTYQERGLTIYSFDNRAAWVNGGLLYTIDGDAPISSEQLLHIATSM